VKKTASNTYKMQQIMTASGTKLVAMLYDKAIVSLNKTIRATEAGDVQARWDANLRTQEILMHLAATLDHEKGGDIAKNLDRLYHFMLNRLLWVDVNNDPTPAREVINLLEPLRQSWNKLASQGTTEKMSTSDPVSGPAYGKGFAISA